MRKLTIIISLIVISFSILFLILPKEKFSSLENRTLTLKPTFKVEDVISGKYMNNIENYISDHFPFKSIFLYLKTSFFKAIGFEEENDVYFGKDSYLIENYSEIDYKEDLVETLKTFKNNTNANIKFMIIPTKIMVYKDKLPKYSRFVDQAKEIEYIYKHADIDSINLLTEFQKEKGNHQLFYKTDHHWTSIGAYFGYKVYRESNNLGYLDLKKLKLKEVTDSFLGSTYSKVTNYNQETDSISIFKFINDLEVEYNDLNLKTKSLYNFDYLNKKDKYSLFLNNNHDLIKITNNDIKNGKLLVIKDSFANSMVPLLINHYHEIDVIDPRYYKRSISKYISDNKIKDVLIIYNYGTLATDKNILSIR